MARNIETQNPTAPFQGSTSGYSGPAGVGALAVDNFSIMRDVVPDAVKIFKDVMGTANEGAFKQGQADRASVNNAVTSSGKLIEEESWLTRDAYSQGVKFTDFTNAQLKTQQGLSDQAAASIKAGDNMDQYTQKAKVHLAKLNDQIDILGLTGAARNVALDQVVEYTVTGQKAYQKTLENNATMNYKKGLNNTSVLTMGAVTQSPDQATAGQNFATGWDSMLAYGLNGDPVNGADDAGKSFLGAVASWTKQMNPSSTEGYMQLNGALDFLDSPRSDSIPSDIKASMLKGLNTKRTEFNDMHNTIRLDSMQRIATQGKITGNYDLDAAKAVMVDASSALVDARITPANYNTLSNSYYDMYAQSNKTGAVNFTNEFGNAYDLAGDPSGPANQRDYWLKKITQEKGANPLPVIDAAVAKAAELGNRQLSIGAYKLLTGPVVSALGGNPADIRANPDGTSTAAWDGMRSKWEEYGATGRADLQHEMLMSIPDSYQRETLKVMLDQGGRDDLATSAEQYAATYMTLKSRSASTYNQVVLELADVDESMFGQKAGSRTSSRYFYHRGDAAQKMYLMEIQSLADRSRNSLLANGVLYSDASGLFRELSAKNLIVQTKDGPMALPAGTLEGLTYTSAKGKSIQPTAAHFGKIVDSLKEDVIQKLGDSADPGFIMDTWLEPENLFARMAGGRMYIQAMDDDGNSVGQEFEYDRNAMIAQLGVVEQANVATTIEGHSKAHNGPRGRLQEVVIPTNKGNFPDNNVKSLIKENIIQVEGYFEGLTKPNVDKKDEFGRVIPWTQDDYLVGNSITYRTLKEHLGQADADLFVSLSYDVSNPEFTALDDKFFESFHKPLNDGIRAAGLPMPDQNAPVYSSMGVPMKSYDKQYVALADALYHGGRGGMDDMIEVFQAAGLGTMEGKRLAIELLEKSPIYRSGNVARNAMLMKSVTSM